MVEPYVLSIDWKKCIIEIDPDLNAATILKDVAPMYDEMVKRFADSEIEVFFTTQNLAMRVLNEITEPKLTEGSMESVARTDITINPATESKD